MQAVIDNTARPGIIHLFARRDYMMRSEKRNGYNYGSAPNGKKPRRRRRRAGFFYIFFTLLLSVLFWPIGMCLLWRRKLRWKTLTKLITSVLTLFLCITLIGFGLTVQTDDPTVTKVQDSVNDFLDASVEGIAKTYTVICDRAVMAWEGVADLADAVATTQNAQSVDVEPLLTALDTVSVWANKAHDAIFPDSEPVETTDDPTATPEVTDEPTEAPTAEPTEAPTPTPTATPRATVTAPEVAVEEGTLPIEAPAGTPDPVTGIALESGILTRDGEFIEVTPSPTPTAEPTEEPTSTPEIVTTDAVNQPTEIPATKAPEVTATAKPTSTPTPVVDPDLMPKPAGEAVVYYYNSGVGYHSRPSCSGMNGAPAKTLADAVAAGKRACRTCQPVDGSILDAENVIWVDENSSFHLSDDCADFSGGWTLMAIEEALNSGATPCGTCKAGLFMAACGYSVPTPTPAPTATPTPTPTPSPTPSPTPEPTPVPVTPSMALKPASKAIVYHSSNGSFYHTASTCKNMSGSSPYPLGETVADGFRRCNRCAAPLPELLKENCLWMDVDGLCHTTDECLSFAEGKYTLVPRDEALEVGHEGCIVCGADEYLTPDTVIAEYPEYVEPTASADPAK